MRQVKTLVRKEVLDILRDRKTLVMMVVVPILLYPLIIVGMSLVFSYMMQSQESVEHTVGYRAEYREVAEELQTLLAKEKEPDSLTFVPAEPDEEAAVEEASDAWMDLSRDESGVWHVTVRYASSDEASAYAEEALEGLLEKYRERLLEENLRKEGLGEEFLHPLLYEEEDRTSVSESFGMDIGGSIGMILIVTILMGAVYPAIDATAGEKERGTLETLLTLPVTNFQMILSKFISVAFFACVTALLSLLSLGGSVLFLMFGLSPELAGELQGFSVSEVLSEIPLLVVTLIVTALLVTALCMSFCLFARSFKEANNYVTPVMLVVMFASMSAMVPSVRLDYRTALIPFVNVSLMVKQIIARQFDAGLVGTTILANLGYSIAVIWILARLYNSEDILFSDGFRGLRLFQKRSEIRKGTTPGVGDLVISITLLLLLMLYAGSAVSVRNAFVGVVVSQLMILALPLLVTWYMKSDRKTLFSLRKPSVRTCVSGVILYVGAYMLMLAFSAILLRLLPDSAENLQETFVPIVEQPLPVLLLVTALLPAVGEELLFRGFLFGSLREAFGKRRKGGFDGVRPGEAEDEASAAEPPGCVRAVLLSALVFGLFHMSLVKLLPTALLGAAFALIVWKGGSIYVTMALHFLNNALAMLALTHPELVEKFLPFLAQEQFSAMETVTLLTAGLALATAGTALLYGRDKWMES